jgi:hypothetical protein
MESGNGSRPLHEHLPLLTDIGTWFYFSSTGEKKLAGIERVIYKYCGRTDAAWSLSGKAGGRTCTCFLLVRFPGAAEFCVILLPLVFVCLWHLHCALT